MTESNTDALLSAARLALLARLAHTFNSSLDLDQVLNRVMDEVILATQAERGFLMLRQADGALVFRAARGLDRRTVDLPEFQVSRGVINRVVQEGRPLLTDNAQRDPRLDSSQTVRLLGLRSIVCVPLEFKGRIVGVVYVDNRLQAGRFTQEDLELLTAIASSAAIAIENARLYQVAVDKGRMERELQVAREVQLSLLPRELPHLDGWEFAADWRPAREVAGDFYDFLWTETGQLGLVIADVADKGMPAALFMALSRSILRASLTAAHSPAEGIARANRLICADAANGMFVTLFYAQIDPWTGEVRYVNAGHNPPMLVRSGSDGVVRLPRTTMALGIEVAVPVEQGAVNLQHGDVLALYTDGVTEALNASGQEFGEARLKGVLLGEQQALAAERVAAVQRELAHFVGTVVPFDDTTVVVARRI